MKTVEVRIYGQTYSLKVDLEEEEVRRLAGLVDQRMKEVASASPTATSLQVAILAALDLVGEYATDPRLKIDPDIEVRVETKADAMLRMIDAVAAESELA